MNLVGRWQVVGLPDRELVFHANGTGYFAVESEHMPFFKWQLSNARVLGWQFFLDSAMTQVSSRMHEPAYQALNAETELLFSHAPFPFGIKHFKRVSTA
jgi:hypothetical protein